MNFDAHGLGDNRGSIKTMDILKTRFERMSDDYWDAISEYDYDEAIEVLAEKWGYSTYRVKAEIKKIEEGSWL